ncbi:MAG: ATP-dependent helicase, RecQ-like [Actinomycetia bacterium]|nr:ATP-dependent helicase, RecQ-like [Actinomycetes bacterium]
MTIDPDFDTEATASLRRLVGHPDAEFREGQLEAIAALVRDRRRVLVVQRTGWGKSAVYFVTTALMRARGMGPTLLVSPLLGLMRNQIAAAERGGVRAVTINSDNVDDWDAITAELDADAVDVVLVSPERFANPKFRANVLPNLAPRAGLFVIDEVHCISDWGHDFRPDYRRLARVLELLPPGVPVLGTTATANNRVIDDVGSQLGADLLTLRGTLDRESLALDALEIPSQPHRLAWLAQTIPQLEGTGIVYTLTVADAHRVADWLRSRGIAAAAYAGETAIADKLQIEADLLANDLKVVVATSALGMGYDKPDLAFVIHYQSPGSPIAYYQQVGRAGRGVPRAEGVLLTGYEDRDIQDYFIRNAFPPREQAEAVVALLAEAADWVRIHDIESQVNVRRGRLTSMLKNLEVDGAVEREGMKYRRTLAPWNYDPERVERVTAERRREQAMMRDYASGTTCLMEFLRHELDDPAGAPCGRCSRCTGTGHDASVEPELLAAAHEYIRSQALDISTRKQQPDAKRIPKDEQLAAVWPLSEWADGGWGTLVKDEKPTGAFSDELVGAFVARLRAEIELADPPPTWVTAVPSRRTPTLVASVAARAAAELGLPYVEALEKIRETQPQRELDNSAQQARNVGGAFRITGPVSDEPVILVDDLWDSGWTLTTIGAVLREGGSGPVYGAVLARATGA